MSEQHHFRPTTRSEITLRTVSLASGLTMSRLADCLRDLAQLTHLRSIRFGLSARGENKGIPANYYEIEPSSTSPSQPMQCPANHLGMHRVDFAHLILL